MRKLQWLPDPYGFHGGPGWYVVDVHPLGFVTDVYGPFLTSIAAQLAHPPFP